MAKRKQRQPQPPKEHTMHGGQHHVKQDGAGESQITDADLAEFNRLKADPNLAHQANRFITRQRRLGKDGKPILLSSDMRLHPKTYGFADSAAAAEWQAQVELADE